MTDRIIYDRAGSRACVEPSGYRDAAIRCGNCGEKREARINARCRPYHLECAVCGHYAAVETDPCPS